MLAQIGQNSLGVDGQVSVVGSYASNNPLDLFLQTRYIPRPGYGTRLDSAKWQGIGFEASANFSGSVSSLVGSKWLGSMLSGIAIHRCKTATSLERLEE